MLAHISVPVRFADRWSLGMGFLQGLRGGNRPPTNEEPPLLENQSEPLVLEDVSLLPPLKSLSALLEEHQESIHELLDIVQQSQSLTQAFQKEDLEILCLRMLLAHNTHEKALTQLEKNAEWRLRFETWKIPQTPADSEKHPLEDCFGQMLSSGFTKRGRPITVVLFGRVNICQLLEVPIEEYTRWALANIVRDVRYYSRVSRERNVLLESFVVVDLKGMSTQSLKFLPYVQIDTELGDLFCPSTTGIIAAVNVPFAFSIVWNLLRPILSAETLSKINIFHNPTKASAFLTQSVSSDELPCLYGGDKYSVVDEWVAHHDPEMEIMTIKAGKSQCIEIEVQSGTRVHWMVILKNKDIDYAVVFEGDDDVGHSVVSEQTRISHRIRNRGEFTCESSGMLRIHLDNSFSSFSSKTVHYHFRTITDAQEIAGYSV